MLLAYLRGEPQAEIAGRYGITQQAVSQAIKYAQRDMSPEDISTLKGAATAMIVDLLDIHYERAAAEDLPPAFFQGAPLKDENGNIVRDARSSRDATDTVIKLLQRLAAMHGTDAATKADVNTSVRYTYEGVDPDAV